MNSYVYSFLIGLVASFIGGEIIRFFFFKDWCMNKVLIVIGAIGVVGVLAGYFVSDWLFRYLSTI